MNDETTTEENQTEQPKTEMQQLAETIAATANENVALKAKVAKLEADAKLAEERITNERRSNKFLGDEIQMAHSVLDCLPSAPPRKSNTQESYPSEFTIPLHARISCWLAGQLKR